MSTAVYYRALGTPVAGHSPDDYPDEWEEIDLSVKIVDLGDGRIAQATEDNTDRLGIPFRRLTGITGYTGGGTNFDAIPTDGVYVAGQWIGFNHPTDGLRIFELKAGTTATSSPGIIRPTDYSASHQFYWALIN